jgi:hypothetical protein
MNENTSFHVFGIGMRADDLHYIGWTGKPVDGNLEQILAEVVNGSGDGELPHWVDAARHGGQLSIFEIEPAASREAARSAASFFCEYFRSLGRDVVTGPH